MTDGYSYYPLTYPQKNIYQTEITYPGTSIGLITATMRIVDDNIDLKKMEKTLNLIIEHNDSMRIRVKIVGREPRQYFAEYNYEKYEIIDLRNQPIEKLYDFDKKQTETPIDLIDNQLYRFTLLWLSDNEFAVFLKIHHLISDGWSTVRIGNYILDYYEKLQKGIDIDFENTPSYREYILSETEYLSGELFVKDKEFWNNKFQDAEEPSKIKPRKSNLVGTQAKRKTFVLPDKLTKQLRQYCKDTRTSIFGVILSAFAIYLNRTTQKDIITIGTLVLNRSNRRQKNTVGMFISTVPIKVEFEGETNFTEFNKLLTREWMAVLKHQKYPFELLLKDIRERNKDSKDLFDIVFSYQNASFTENTSSKERTSRWHFNHAQKESLTIHIHDRDDVGKLLLDYDYLVDLFQEKEIEFIHDNFIRVLWHALDDPKRQMSKLELISEEEKNKILYDFNSNEIEFDTKKTLVDLFVEQAEKTPEQTAIVWEDKKVTYSQLNLMSNSLANTLVSQGVKADDIVCLIFDKSIEMIVTILAILKSGAAYLSVDGEFPAERKRYLFNDSQSKILITTEEYKQESEFKGKVISITDHDFSLNTQRPEAHIKASDLAYIIYTSGTTGQPKGVMIEHKSIVNYVYSFLDEFKYTGQERVLVHSSYTYDGFVEEIYPGLSSGATLVISNKYGAKDMQSMAKVIRKHNVSIIGLTPLVLSALNKMNNFPSMRKYLTGGDVLKYEYMNNLLENAEIHNTYGPTEATVCAAFHKCDKTIKDNIPIGKPIANYKIYILDANLNLVPIGVPGELYISGPSIARGYLNKPDLTSEAFLDNPFLPGGKMYRTKDMARWYPMGDIEYLGRADRQVKIRGMRVELGEIESKLLKNDNIHSAVVTAKTDENNKKLLCAYYESSSQITVHEIREYLRKELAAHMIPSYYLEMDKIPLSASGKVNYNSLPGLDNMVINEESQYVAPNDDVEERLAKLIENLLKVTKVGINDNYFELGGDSLDITTLAYDIIDEFNVEIPLECIFKSDTVKDIAEFIKIAVGKEKEITPHREKNLILLNRGEDGNKNIIFVHDGIGGIGAYVKLCQYIGKYNVWGLRASQENNLHPRNTTIEEIARSYVEQIIDECSPPYNIAGWCIGGTIAYEIVRQMENMNLNVNSLLMIDTIPPMVWKDENRFSLENEILFIGENIKSDGVFDNTKNVGSIKLLWETVVENIEQSDSKEEIINEFAQKVPQDILGYLDGFGHSTIREIFLFINQLRTFHIARAFYVPIEKIKSDIVYLGAEKDSVVEDSSKWTQYTRGEVFYKTISGNHYTMMEMPAAEKLIETIKGWAI